jgi:hypothetical protein
MPDHIPKLTTCTTPQATSQSFTHREGHINAIAAKRQSQHILRMSANTTFERPIKHHNSKQCDKSTNLPNPQNKQL